MKLKKETLINLGFKETWPDGNPTEPWWKNKELNFTFYNRPTVNEFFDKLKEIYKKEGREQVQNMIKKALLM